MLSQKAISPVQYSSIEDRVDTVINGETIVELTTPILPPAQKIGISSTAPIRPSTEMSSRPDLVSLAMTRTADRADEIMYFNEISNPFSISDEHVFFLPDPTDVSNAKAMSKSEVSKWTKRKAEVSQSQKELNKNANVQDKKRVIELMKQNDPKGVQEAFRLSGISEAGVNLATGKTATLDELMSSLDILRTPGMTTEEQTQKLRDKIVFGTNVVNKKCTAEITTTQGKSQIIRQNLLKKIKTKQIDVPKPSVKPVLKPDIPTAKDALPKTIQTVQPTLKDSLISNTTLNDGSEIDLSTALTKKSTKTTIDKNPMKHTTTNVVTKLDPSVVSIPLHQEISIEDSSTSTIPTDSPIAPLKTEITPKTVDVKIQRAEFKPLRDPFKDR